MQQKEPICHTTGGYASDSDSDLRFKIVIRGRRMRLGKIEDQSVRSEHLKSDEAGDASPQLTPARRAALDALERELRDLLQAR